MSDTTTTLNPGSAGDVMDEELVLQSDNVTQAKAPRVVIRGPAQNSIVQPVNTDPGKNPYSVPAAAVGVVNDTPESYVPGELRPISLTTEGRMRVAVVQSTNYIDFFGDDEPDYTSNANYTISENPWGT